MTVIAPEPPALFFKDVLSSGLQLAEQDPRRPERACLWLPSSGVTVTLLLKNHEFWGPNICLPAYVDNSLSTVQSPQPHLCSFFMSTLSSTAKRIDLSIVQLVWQILKDTLSHSSRRDKSPRSRIFRLDCEECNHL